MFLEEIGKLKALAVDKTGTITEGKPRVQQVIPWNGKSEEEILRVAAAIDTHSEHPLAVAIVVAAHSRDLNFEPAADYLSVTGQGARANIDGHPHFIGNHRMAHDAGVCSPEIEAILAGISTIGSDIFCPKRLIRGFSISINERNAYTSCQADGKAGNQSMIKKHGPKNKVC